MTIQIVTIVMLLGVFPIQDDDYSLGVHNGSKFTVDDVKVVSKDIEFMQEFGNIPAGIHRSKGVLGDRVPGQVLVQWSRGGHRFSEVIRIPEDVRRRVVGGSRLYVRILDDGKAAAYVEIFNPLDLTKRTYYPPEFAPKEDK